MKTIEEHIQTPIKGEYDVIVAGSGPSGMAAAVNAARLGAKVLVIEAQGSVGGISTTGMMSHFTGSVGNPTFAELLRRMAAKNRFENGVIKRQIDPEMLKIIYLEMLAESGAEVLLYTLVCGVVRDGDRVTGVICENKSGRAAYLAKVVIDASGDGDVGDRRERL